MSGSDPTSMPAVTFVVPCYKLGHLLADCVHSILSQTYDDFEVLIMDDCSPDQTAAVAQSFQDSRVKHVRNEPNLGHLRNYNKGISLARGKYVWLISADDRLRRPYILERYIQVMESHPKVGYIFCPAMGLLETRETRIMHSHGTQDAVFPGHEFLLTLLNSNSVAAPAGMVRRDCYDKLGAFPLDMPWGGDWYLWCLFALHYDVAYLAEAMVNYRVHELSMTNTLMSNAPHLCTNDDLALQWRIKQKAEEAGCATIVKRCRHMIAYEYARNMDLRRYEGTSSRMTEKEVEESLRRLATGRREERLIRARVHACVGDQLFWRNDVGAALRSYLQGLRHDPSMLGVWAKCFLLGLGGLGMRVRRRTRALRESVE